MPCQAGGGRERECGKVEGETHHLCVLGGALANDEASPPLAVVAVFVGGMDPYC
jgi:hypothetical protein